MATQWELWIDGTLSPHQPGQSVQQRWRPQWAVLLPIDDNGKYSQSARPVGLFRHKENPSIAQDDDLIDIAQRHARQLLWQPLPNEVVILTDGLVMDNYPLEGKYTEAEIQLILTGRLEERFVFAKETPVIAATPHRNNQVTYNALPQAWLKDWFLQLQESLGNLPVKTVSIGMLLLNNLSKTQFSTTQGYCLLLSNTVLWIAKDSRNTWQLVHQTILPNAKITEAFYAACLPPPQARFTSSDTISVISLHPGFTTRQVGTVLQEKLAPVAVRPWQTNSPSQQPLRDDELIRFIQTISQNASRTKADIPGHCQFSLYKDHSRASLYTRLLSGRLLLFWLVGIVGLLFFGLILHARTHALEQHLKQAQQSPYLSQCAIAQQHNQWLNNVAQPLFKLTGTSASTATFQRMSLSIPNATRHTLELNVVPYLNDPSGAQCDALQQSISAVLPSGFTLQGLSKNLTSAGVCRYQIAPSHANPQAARP